MNVFTAAVSVVTELTHTMNHQLLFMYMRFGCVRVTDSNDFQLACKYLSDTHALIQLMRAQNCIPMQRICLTIEIVLNM